MCKFANKEGLSTTCVNKEQFKIEWLQTIYSVNHTFTQKQIPRQNEKFNFFSANNVSVYHV